MILLHFITTVIAMVLNSLNTLILHESDIYKVWAVQSLFASTIAFDTYDKWLCELMTCLVATVIHLIILYEYIHLKVTELQAFRMKLFTALQSHNLLNENIYDSYAINHVIEEKQDDSAKLAYKHLAQSQGSQFFQGDKDITESLMEMQIVNTIHNGRAENAPRKTFRSYYNYFIAVERHHQSEAEFTLQM